jgi:branched-chain amino acid transport system ATP-binding protein
VSDDRDHVRSRVLSLRDVHVHLGRSHVLQGVDLNVARGGVTGLLGRNGVGKTTTVKAVLGLVPRAGSVLLDGEEIASASTPSIVRRGVGYVPEDRDVFSGLTVEENLRLAEPMARAHGGKPDLDLVHDLFPELATRRRQKAGTLSGGQQQMVALARVLLGRPKLLLVDEPTKGLAPKLVTDVAQVLARAAQYTTVLLVEQNLTVVRHLVRDVVVLDAGRVVHAGPAADLLSDAARTKELLGVASRSAPSSSTQSERPPRAEAEHR